MKYFTPKNFMKFYITRHDCEELRVCYDFGGICLRLFYIGSCCFLVTAANAAGRTFGFLILYLPPAPRSVIDNKGSKIASLAGKIPWQMFWPTSASPFTTRKPSWRKGKRATAVRVWRPIAKKSTANFQLMVNSNRGRITYGLRIARYFPV